jgi:hypothetical protein
MRSFIIIFVLFLTGCLSTPAPKQKTALEAFGPQCQSYGFTPGTDKFSECIMAIDQKNKDIIRALLIRNATQ